MITPECAFCSPEAFLGRTISQNELAIAVLSSPRLTPGHSLVIPKRHIEPPDTPTDEEIVAIFRLIHPLQARILGGLAAGTDIWQKSRPRVEQNDVKVNHTHYHVIPSNPGNPRYEGVHDWRHEQFAPLTANERHLMLEILSI